MSQTSHKIKLDYMPERSRVFAKACIDRQRRAHECNKDAQYCIHHRLFAMAIVRQTEAAYFHRAQWSLLSVLIDVPMIEVKP